MIEELKRIKEEYQRVLYELRNNSDESAIKKEIEQAANQIRQKHAEKRAAEIAEKELEIRALNNIISREESKRN